MISSAMLQANDKWASMSYNPGWGEPGEWSLSFSDGSSLRIDNAEGMGNQEEYLRKFTADKYRDAVITNNWIRCGDEDDVLRIMLEFVGYDEACRLNDLQNIEKLKQLSLESFSDIIKDFGTSAYRSYETDVKNRKFNNVFTKALDIAEILHKYIFVYDELKAGKSVGMNWSNESFLREFPDSPFAPKVRELMEQAK